MDVIFQTDASGDWMTIGSNVSVYNGAYTQTPIGMAEYGTTYYWSVNCTDGLLWTNETYTFTTLPLLNSPPVLSNENPANESRDISILLSQLMVTIEDPDGDKLNWTIETSPNIGHQDNSSASEGNGTKICNISGLTYSTVYTWYVNFTDGFFWINHTYWFETESLLLNNNPPIPDEGPENESTEVNVSTSLLSVNITDPDEDLLDYTTVETSSENIIQNNSSNVTVSWIED